MVPLLYAAGPLGFSEAGRYWYYREFVPMIERCGFVVIDPWKLTDPAIIEAAMKKPEGREQREAWAAANTIIGANNEQGIRKSHLVCGVLDGPDVDSGTASEIGFGYGIGRLIEGYRSDFRLSSDNIGSIVNLQVEYWIRTSGGNISGSIEVLEPVLVARACEILARS